MDRSGGFRALRFFRRGICALYATPPREMEILTERLIWNILTITMNARLISLGLAVVAVILPLFAYRHQKRSERMRVYEKAIQAARRLDRRLQSPEVLIERLPSSEFRDEMAGIRDQLRPMKIRRAAQYLETCEKQLEIYANSSSEKEWREIISEAQARAFCLEDLIKRQTLSWYHYRRDW